MAERLIIAGGGLSGVLTALALLDQRPDIDLTVVEQGPTLGGDHTWSFYETDLDARGTALLDPLVAYRWSSYECKFRDLSRSFTTGYRSVTSEAMHDYASARLGSRVHYNTQVASIDADGVTLADGRRLDADAVIDARGGRQLDGTALRWQKFLGREVRLTRPHGLTRPMIMDASVSQIDGYRFVYVLPFTEDTVLIEDTYYSEGRDIEPDDLRARIDDYAAGRGWEFAEVIREEQGALPLLLSVDFPKMWADAAPAGGAVPLGLRAALFHPVTGYSLPCSARMAIALSDLRGPLTTTRLREVVGKRVKSHLKESKFDRLLSRMLFLCGEPQNRHLVLERFHRLPQGLIERFYAGKLGTSYKLRILMGKPPVPFFDAVQVVPETAAFHAR